MQMLLIGISIGFVFGYAMGLFIDKIDKREKQKNARR